MNSIRKVSSSFAFLFQGTQSIFMVPGLMRFAIIPFIIDLFLGLFALIWGGGQIGGWVTAAVAWMVTPGSFFFTILYYPLFIIFWAVFIVLVIYGTFLVSTVVSAPFNTLLAERVLMNNGVIRSQPFRLKKWLSLTLKMAWVGLIRGIVFGLLGIIIFILSFIPGVNLAAAFAAFMIMACDCLDYSFEAMQLDFNTRMKYFKLMMPEVIGMSGAFTATIVIPGLTVILMPAAVVGAANLVSKASKRGELP